MSANPQFCTDKASYMHTPYDNERGCIVEFEPQTRTQKVVLPKGTLHKMLNGHVTFAPYPKSEFSVPELTGEDTQYFTVKMFIGQLPLNVTGMQLAWICHMLGGRVASPQRIMKTVDGQRQPTGGVHVFCDEQTYDILHQNMHKRILVDDTGIWFAADWKEKAALDSYVEHMHTHRSMRHAGRPHDSVVVQRAVSTYVPRRVTAFDGTAQ
jgi:hypothetical protein